MDFDDLIVERAPTAGAPADQPDRHFCEGAVMLAYAMHLLRTEPIREVRIHPDGQHARQVDFPGWSPATAHTVPLSDRSSASGIRRRAKAIAGVPQKTACQAAREIRLKSSTRRHYSGRAMIW
jgi:hypothetical protein